MRPPRAYRGNLTAWAMFRVRANYWRIERLPECMALLRADRKQGAISTAA